MKDWRQVDREKRVERMLSIKELMLLNCGVGELLRVSWRAWRSVNPKGNTEYSLEGLMLRFQYLAT